MERSIDQHAVLALLDVAGAATMKGCKRIHMEYQRTDNARNTAVRVFLKNTTDDADVLVMLDADHRHPTPIVPYLASACDAEHEVVGALAFRRSLPHDPCFYTLHEGQPADVPTGFTTGLRKCDIVGTGAIAIRRSVFKKLDANGFRWPYFRYIYNEADEIQRSEDWHFGLECQKAGIAHWVAQDMMTPHLASKEITHASWFETLDWAVANPEEANAKYASIGFSFKVGNNEPV
jgi:hypothetical protein